MSDDDMRTIIERRLQHIDAAASHASPVAAVAWLATLHADVGHFVEVSKARLLATSLAWSDPEKAEARWIHDMNQRLAALCCRLAEGLRHEAGVDDARTLQGIAFALLYIGEAMKWEIASGARAPRDYRTLHALIRHAIAAGRESSPLRIDVGGRERACTLESLYFRALLLARFAGGNLSSAQIEILDEWLWMWAPLLQGVRAPPAGPAMRADLDSANGLRRGKRADGGPALYLAQGPIETAFHSLVAQFHSGRIVPSDGCTARFPIEVHVAVLDLVRRGLRASRRETVVRAARQAMNVDVEVYVGLAEIEQRGFLRATAPHRLATLVDVSESGLGFEGAAAACESMAVGELVGARLTPASPLLIGTVTRRIPSATPGRVVVGVRRVSADARVIGVTRGAAAGARGMSMVYVRGGDRSGCRDACLVGERTFEEGGTFETAAGEKIYGFRFNRVRARGPGWILAGFEVVGTRTTAVPAARPRA